MKNLKISNQIDDSEVFASMFQINSFAADGYGIRHILINRDTALPMPASSVYETHLAQKTDSHNTRRRVMFFFSFLYSWAEENFLNLDQLLLSGNGLSLPQIRSFASWIRASRTNSNGLIPQEKRRSINAVFGTCSMICCWFISQYSNVSTIKERRAIDVELLVQSQKRAWKEVQIKVRKNNIAPDLSESEINKIEKFLRPENRSNAVGDDIAVRDYLIWRMAIEFGMRIGEILAMRTIDCPTRQSSYFKIVRIEERGNNYTDPRQTPPRPKTLSRDLGFILDNTVFPKLVSDYVSNYRYKTTKRNNKVIKQFLLPHNFLIISRNGKPLSIRSAGDIANTIKRETGVDFNWHLARHAFFNRAYAEVASIEDREQQQVKLSDLVFWGGWESEKSLEIYTKRARAERARNVLSVWQNGGNKWTALV